MYIYTFTSRLFVGQYRRIITSYPVRNKVALVILVNEDNSYNPEDRWLLQTIES